MIAQTSRLLRWRRLSQRGEVRARIVGAHAAASQEVIQVLEPKLVAAAQVLAASVL